MLSLQKNVTIRESAVTLGHAELAEPAAAVLRKYADPTPPHLGWLYFISFIAACLTSG